MDDPVGTVTVIPAGLKQVAQERYGLGERGGVQKALHTLETDPVGVVADVAGVMTGAGGAGRGAIRAAARPAQGGVRKAAEWMYGTTLKPQTAEELVRAERMRAMGQKPRRTPAQYGLDEGIVPTARGVGKTEAREATSAIRRITEEVLPTIQKQMDSVEDRIVGSVSRMPPGAQEYWAKRFQNTYSDLKDRFGHLQGSVDQIDVPNLVPDELIKLRNALKVGRGDASPFEVVASSIPRGAAGAGVAYTLGGGIPGMLVGGMTGYLSKSPGFIGRSAIALDRTGRIVPATTEAALRAALLARLMGIDEETAAALDAEMRSRRSPQ